MFGLTFCNRLALSILLPACAASQTAAAPPPDYRSPQTTAAQAAVGFLRSQQIADGSILLLSSTPGSTGAIGDVADDIFAMRSAGAPPAAVVTASGKSLLSPLYTITTTKYMSGQVDRMGKLALGLAAADLDPRAFNGLDLVVSMTQFYSASSGSFGDATWNQALAMLGWAASGEAIPMTATQNLAGRITPSGGFEYSTGWGADTNTTGLVLQALVAGGASITSTEVLSALAYLKFVQRNDAGWGYDGFSAVGDANSTSYAVQGLLAAGNDPFSTMWQISSTHPISFLLSGQQLDGGIVYTSAPPGNNSATAQAIPALMGGTFPYASRAVAQRKALAYIAAQQQPNGGFNGFGVGSTVDAINAILAAGGSVRNMVSVSGTTPLQYLAANPQYPGQSAAAAGKYAVGVIGAGGNPRNVAGLNLVISMTQSFSTTTGRFGNTVYDQSWTLLGLVAARVPISPVQVSQLISVSASGGGYGYSANDVMADPDSTGLALLALHATGVRLTAPVVRDALAYLRGSQLTDGGWASFGSGADANSTGLVHQTLAVYGLPTRGLAFTMVMTTGNASRLITNNPADALLKLQQADGGYAASFSRPDASYAAAQSLGPAMFPFKRVPTQFLPAVFK